MQFNILATLLFTSIASAGWVRFSASDGGSTDAGDANSNYCMSIKGEGPFQFTAHDTEVKRVQMWVGGNCDGRSFLICSDDDGGCSSVSGGDKISGTVSAKFN
ncbi:hypothetical protein AJ79_05693 [Helicocarpus griseus UAMH5409]|uniref:Uncharacterized protein n=1 Tax=Helicocarpus griseus UAMH5409 TaxID=1447875 RepID=A0A2B7XKS6_9EURO|nr:hypothetical protein AJ79_05693 [Helicocarpus griseus UAMH5409]